MRLLIIIFYRFVIFVLSLLVFLSFLLTTSTGASLVFKLINLKLPGKLMVTGIEGRLLNHLTIDSLRYQNATFNVTFKKIDWEWQSLSIFHHQLIIKADSPTPSTISAHINAASHQLSFSTNIKTLYFNQPLTATLRYQNQHLTALANLGPNVIHLTGNNFFPLQINATLPKPALLHPSLNGLETSLTAKATLIDEAHGTLAIKIAQGKFERADLSPLFFEGGELKGQLSSKGLHATGRLALDKDKKTQFTATMPHFNLYSSHFATEPISAKVALSINKLDFISQLNPLIGKTEGKLRANLSLKGTFEKPVTNGQILLQDAKVGLPLLGITLVPKNILLKSQDNKWHLKGVLASETNAFTLEGNGNFFPSVYGTIALKGQNVLIMKTNEYQIYASPNLNFEFTPELLKIRGKIFIPKARINPEVYINSVSLSEDVIFVKNEAPLKSTFALDTDVHLQLGDDIMLNLQGLKGYLIGGLQFRQLPNTPLTAIGQLDIAKGVYKAYGQDLIIQQGQLLFTGGIISNPTVQVRAIKQLNASNTLNGSNKLWDFNSANLENFNLASHTQVGIQVNGHLNSPKVKLFSNPNNLSQADILSLLLLGKPANQADKSGAQLLLTAASALKLDSSAQSLQLLQELKQKLGLDLNVQNTLQYNQKTNQTQETTALVLGKALFQRLYISYNVGLSQTNNNVLTLKYLLNKFFSVQVSTSALNSGIDLLYNANSG